MANITISNGSITVKQGTTCDWAYALKAGGTRLDLTGYSCAMQVRRTMDSPTPVLSLSIGSGISLNLVDNQFEFHLEPAQTSDIRFVGDSLSCVYDVEFTDASGVVTGLPTGTFTINREVTR